MDGLCGFEDGVAFVVDQVQAGPWESKARKRERKTEEMRELKPGAEYTSWVAGAVSKNDDSTGDGSGSRGLAGVGLDNGNFKGSGLLQE